MHPTVKTLSTVPMMALKDRKSFIKAIRTAKRVASGKRAAVACSACKRSRARCDDTRPCKRCRSLGICTGCEMPDSGGSIQGDSTTAVHLRSLESYNGAVKVENAEAVPSLEASDYAKPQNEAHDSGFNRQNATFYGQFSLEEAHHPLTIARPDLDVRVTQNFKQATPLTFPQAPHLAGDYIPHAPAGFVDPTIDILSASLARQILLRRLQLQQQQQQQQHFTQALSNLLLWQCGPPPPPPPPGRFGLDAAAQPGAGWL